MAKKVFENDEELDTLETFDEEVKVAEYQPHVKQMVRKMGAQPTGDVDAIQTVDSELSSWISNGWKLSFVERLATEPEGHTVLYILTKD